MNGTYTVLPPLCQHPHWKNIFSRLLSHCGWVCQATICSHVAFSLVAFDFKNGCVLYWEKCCLNISWYKYGKWFEMVPGGSSEFHIMSSTSLPCFLSVCSPRQDSHWKFSTPKPLFLEISNSTVLVKHSLFKHCCKSRIIHECFGGNKIWILCSLNTISHTQYLSGKGSLVVMNWALSIFWVIVYCFDTFLPLSLFLLSLVLYLFLTRSYINCRSEENQISPVMLQIVEAGRWMHTE